ncbi:MAG: SDR family oxidoreductase [Bacilli bacterium]|nr:SDR family oxidoreductase [Bacilli bacterium]MDE6142354.1 SDR family oxidoreductase [Bacilli bacterium]
MRAVVTGGVKGLGRAFTLELLSRGYEVVATYLTSEEEAKELESTYENLKCVKLDVSNQDEVSKIFWELEDLDLVINNAAIAKDAAWPFKSLDDFMEVVKVNLGGVFIVSRYAATRMMGGTIINISSNNTLGYHNPISMDYDASKAGVNMLTLDFAEALKALEIKVVAIAPGWIDTEAISEADPKYIEEELCRSDQKELLNPQMLAKKIIDDIPNYKSGDVIEIKEVECENDKKFN